jgi:hypothetical protein
MAFTVNLYLIDYKHFTEAPAGDGIAIQWEVMAKVGRRTMGGQHRCSLVQLSEHRPCNRCLGPSVLLDVLAATARWSGICDDSGSINAMVGEFPAVLPHR